MCMGMRIRKLQTAREQVMDGGQAHGHMHVHGHAHDSNTYTYTHVHPCAVPRGRAVRESALDYVVP